MVVERQVELPWWKSVRWSCLGGRASGGAALVVERQVELPWW